VNLKEICKANREAKNAHSASKFAKKCNFGGSRAVFSPPRLNINVFFKKNSAKNFFFQKNIAFLPLEAIVQLYLLLHYFLIFIAL
jgi:hypothetical protein